MDPANKILPSIFGLLFLVLGPILVFRGIRDGLIRRDIQSSHYGSRAKGIPAVFMGLLYICGGIALIWMFWIVVESMVVGNVFFEHAAWID